MRWFDRRTEGDQERQTVAGLSDLQRQFGAGALDPSQLDAALVALVPAFPLKIQIQTATRCNAACAMCPYPEVTGEAGFAHEAMAEDLYREILRQLAGQGVERLSLFLMNEPLVDKRLPDWLGLARAALPTTVLGLFTNGAALDVRLARRLAEAGLDELCISFHGFDTATYDRVMVGLSWRHAEPRLREVLALHAAGGLGALHLQLVAGDVPEVAASLAAADPLFRRYAVLKGFSNERDAVGVAGGLDTGPDPATLARRACQRPFVKLYVLANGDCVLCNVDWRRTVVLGRIGPGPEGQIAHIWQSARYEAVRHMQATGRFAGDDICARCNYPAAQEPA